MRKIFSTLRRIVWTSVASVLFILASVLFAAAGESLPTLAYGLGGVAFALLSLRASQ